MKGTVRRSGLICLLAFWSLPVVAALPPMNPYLADVHNNQGHWNDAATDGTDVAVPRGHYRITEDGFDIVPSDALGIPAYTATVAGKEVHWFFAGFSMRKLIFEAGGFREVHRIDVSPPDGFEYLSAEARLAQALAIQRYLDSDDEEGLAEYLKASPNRLASAVEDQVRAGVLYSLFTREHALIGSNARGLIRIDQQNPADPYSKLAKPLRRTLPSELFDNDRVARNTIFPTDVVFGLSMTFNGWLVINTLGGRIVTLDRNTFDIVDVYAAQGDDELYTNSFAISEELDGGAIYVASNRAMYRLRVRADGTISDASGDGAWRAAYDIGMRLPAGKITDGTGATPTLMGFADGEDELVVLTDGARRMRLVAFWRNEIPESWRPPAGALSNRIADQMTVPIGAPGGVSQSEQSVVVHGSHAFVVNGVQSENVAPYRVRGSFNRGLLIGVTRPPPLGAAMLRWNHNDHRWEALWVRGDIGVLATVPFISGPSRMVVVNGYLEGRLKESYHLGLDLDSGEIVMSVAAGTNPLFNGTFTGVKCDPHGNLMYTTMFGLLRFDVGRMAPAEPPAVSRPRRPETP